MEYLSSREAQNNFGELLDKAQRSPIMIRRYGRDSAVVMSVTEFNEYRKWRVQRLINLMDEVGRKAQENGLTDELLEQLLASSNEVSVESSL
jgi:antitoxin Phd